MVLNYLLVGCPWNVTQRKHMRNNFLSEVLTQGALTQLKSRIFTIKIGLICLYKKLFFFSRLNRLSYFWVFKCQISACSLLSLGSYICGLLLSGTPKTSTTSPRQGYPATSFCKTTVGRSKYCLEISKACEKRNFLDNRSIRLKYSDIF